ncbi:hypothetical protein T440DRAFT_542306 [Plenodomus tracheiphilus IPT5]|uniref:Large ribosomal subunit protein bL34m n=1 Tax=Plenodomus tracheiphilus IPT5 TaxID=1408161 RepID=A0A6A7BH15_9PLEO|nr:hypothetical protein T440DRAFT_542306 [Plenodomus tracheiphilus IPT5]
MNAFKCLRLVARPTQSTTHILRPTLTPTTSPQRPPSLLTPRHFSALAPRRPTLPLSHTLPAPGTPSSLPPSAPQTLDLLGKISAHPGLGSTQIRCGPRDTYNPSHIVRKRRHGFLSRIRTKKGRKTIMRRLKKGRWNISH